MLNRKRYATLFAVLVIIGLAAVACGGDSDAAPASGNEATAASSTSTTTPVLAADDNNGAAQNGAPDDQTAANGGLDPVCVELVLGRTVTGFADITDAERTRIFEECSSNGRGGFGPNDGLAGGARGAGFDPACVEETLGSEATDLTQLTPEQRQEVFAACGGDLAGGGRPSIGQGGQGDGNRPPGGGGFGGGGLEALLQNECAQNVLGRSVEDVSELTQEEIQRLFSECAGAFGGQGGGGFGRGQNGGTGRLGGGQGAPTN